jgi:hypothetical protein
MNKSAFILASIVLSFGAQAGSPQPGTSTPVSALAKGKHDAEKTKVTLKSEKGRVALMGKCQKLAKDAKLVEVDRKLFVSNCMAGK